MMDLDVNSAAEDIRGSADDEGAGDVEGVDVEDDWGVDIDLRVGSTEDDEDWGAEDHEHGGGGECSSDSQRTTSGNNHPPIRRNIHPHITGMYINNLYLFYINIIYDS